MCDIYSWPFIGTVKTLEDFNWIFNHGHEVLAFGFVNNFFPSAQTWNWWKRDCLTFNCFQKTTRRLSKWRQSVPFTAIIGTRSRVCWEAYSYWGNDRRGNERARLKAIRFACESDSVHDVLVVDHQFIHSIVILIYHWFHSGTMLFISIARFRKPAWMEQWYILIMRSFSQFFLIIVWCFDYTRFWWINSVSISTNSSTLTNYTFTFRSS